MLIVAKNLLQRAFLFSVSQKQGRKPIQKQEKEQQPEQKDVYQAYRSQVEKSSILREFRESVFRRSKLNGEWSKIKDRQQKSNQILSDLVKNGQKEEVKKKMTDIQARLIGQRSIFHQNSSKSILSDYGDYTSYSKVFPILEDRNLNQNQFLQKNQVVKNLYGFIDRLPDDYEEKMQIRRNINKLPVNQQNMSLSQYGQLIQRKINKAQKKNNEDVQRFKIHTQGKSVLSRPYPRKIRPRRMKKKKNVHKYTGTPMTIDPWNKGKGLAATLSPGAVDTIYELYLQGWNVRDISKRFGILPARTKFCVWVRAQLYHEIIPKMGVKFYLRALRYQQAYNATQKFCDYGLDIENLSNQSILSEIKQWNGGMLDAERSQDQYRGAMMKLSKQKKFNKYEMLQVGTHGKENSRYSLKQWHIFRGKGSDQYFLRHQVFRKLSKAQRKFNKQYY